MEDNKRNSNDVVDPSKNHVNGFTTERKADEKYVILEEQKELDINSVLHSVKEFEVQEGNKHFSVYNGILYDKVKSILVIPNALKTFGPDVFHGSEKIRVIVFLTIPEKLEDSKDMSYLWKFEVEKIIIPKGSVEDFKKLFPNNIWHMFRYPKSPNEGSIPKFIHVIDNYNNELSFNTDMIIKVRFKNPASISIKLINEDRDIDIDMIKCIDWINYFL